MYDTLLAAWQAVTAILGVELLAIGSAAVPLADVIRVLYSLVVAVWISRVARGRGCEAK